MTFNRYHPAFTLAFGKIDPLLGRDQVYCFKATPFMQLLRLLHPPRGGHMYIMTYDFPSCDWGLPAAQDWFARKRKEVGLQVHVMGGAPSNPSLLEKIAGSTGIDVRFLEDPPTRHLVVLDNPKQLWFEGYHKHGSAYNCYFTSDPFDDAWKGAMAITRDLWKSARKPTESRRVRGLIPAAVRG